MERAVSPFGVLEVGTQILTNISRGRGKLNDVIFGELLYATLALTVFWFISFRIVSAESFIYPLIAINSLVFCYFSYINRDLFSINWVSLAELVDLIRLGVPILIQNTLMFFLYSAGHYYLNSTSSDDVLGVYAFAFSLVIAAQIGAESILWVNFQKCLRSFLQNRRAIYRGKGSKITSGGYRLLHMHSPSLHLYA